MSLRLPILAAAMTALVLGACDDDPFAIRWEENPDTARLFALSRPELNLHSAFDFVGRLPVRLEAATTQDQWDLAVDREGSNLVWLPPRALGVTSRAGVAVFTGETFESVIKAPGDTTRYVTDASVPIRLGEIYVVRTRQRPGAFGTLCFFYGKAEALDVDVAQGVVTFQYDVSPACNDRDLIPPN